MLPPSPGRAVTRSMLGQLLPRRAAPTALAFADLLGPNLDDYAELILGPAARPVGFMTRGEDATFTERVRLILRELDMPGDAVQHHERLATWFEHLRAFAKLEWHPVGDGENAEPLVAVYFRRRPQADDVIARMETWGMNWETRGLVRDVAGLLKKASVHFVAAAFRRGQPVHHKLYFSQFVTPETRGVVATRMERVLGLFGLPQEQRDRWRVQHDRHTGRGETTVFLSFSFTADAIGRSVKIDYPGASGEEAASWLAPEERPAVIAEVARACELAGRRRLSYLGVRLEPGCAPALKYYADL